MSAPMIPRTLPGPEKDWLTEAEVMAFLNVESRTLDTYIATGRFPRGVKWGRQSMWQWLDVTWFYLTKQLSDRFSAPPDASPEEEEEEVAPAATGARKRRQDAVAPQ